jgi:poly-gamma-glutamate synthesis protein (capsule biosynthesis protein)
MFDGRGARVARRTRLGGAAAGAAALLVGLGAACAEPSRPGPSWVSPTPAAGATAGSGASSAGPRTLTILGAGDILVHPQVWEQARADASAAGRTGFDFFPMFGGVSPAIAGADLAICHLETPLADPDGPFAGYPTFNTPPQVLDGVARAGFDACSTASNHTIDHGEPGVRRTVAALDAAGLGHTGSARSAAEGGTPTVYDAAGVRVGHLSYTAHLNGLRRPAGKEWLANLIDPARIESAARKLRAAGAEIVVLSLHWGTEYRHAPDADQRAWAARLIASSDIDLILGHHAHVVQPFERFGAEWVVYGMGNELARHAEPIDANREGVMARITFTESAPGTWRVTRAEAIPTWTQISPAIRLIDLPAALADPATPAAARRIYQAAYNRIERHVLSRGAATDGLVVARPGG